MSIKIVPTQKSADGCEWILQPGESVTIGRESSDLSFPHDQLLSRRHCVIHCLESYAVVRDLKSKNGTFLNSQRTYHARIHPGDVICVGSQILRVVHVRNKASLDSRTGHRAQDI